MAFVQKKKVEELKQEEAAGSPDEQPRKKKPVFHVHRDSEGNFVSGHLIETEESQNKEAHLDDLLARIEARGKD